MSLTSDLGAAAGMFLFTGAETIGDGTMFEIISKFGVIAVLWFWLRDLKKEAGKQHELFDSKITQLTVAFEDETDEIRESYEKIIDKMTTEYHTYSSKLESLVQEQRDQTKQLHDKICELHSGQL